MAPHQPPGLTERVRERCAEVAAEARHVRIAAELVPLYTASLTSPAPLPPAAPAGEDRAAREWQAAHWLTLDAVNFGSGWFPTLRKRPGRTGYATVADGVRRRFEGPGPWSAEELCVIKRRELAELFGQAPGHELMERFAVSLRDLGRQVLDGYDGSFLAVVEDADGSAVRLVETLAAWPSFADSSEYRGRAVPFLKRAQIAAADVHRAGVAQFTDLDRLTMFADNLVPHVLRLDGVLAFEPALVARIEREELIEHGSEEEVEIRACAVHAVELVVAASPPGVTAAEVDQLLWHRGQQRRYKAVPRHRSRSTAY